MEVFYELARAISSFLCETNLIHTARIRIKIGHNSKTIRVSTWWEEGDGMKKWLLGILGAVVLLSGCASKESKALRDDENVQAEIRDTIIQKGKDDFNLELAPMMDKLKFDFQNALPIIDDKRLRVPVRTTNKPIFQFDASIKIEADNSGYRALGEIDIDNGGLHALAEYLLTKIYRLEHKSKLDTFLNNEKGVSLYSVKVMAKTSVFIEDEKEKEKLIKSMTADYNAGKFDDPSQYADLLSKHMLEEDRHNNEGYLPDLKFDVELTPSEQSKKKSPEEKFEKVIDYVRENESNLPSGKYIFSMYTDEERKNRLSEYITINHKK